MGDYTGYIALTYGVSAVALILLALRTVTALRRTEREVSTLRQARKNRGGK